MTNSKRPSDLDDTEIHIPTSLEDVAALKRVQRLDVLTDDQYVKFLMSLPPSPPSRKTTPPDAEPFEL